MTIDRYELALAVLGVAAVVAAWAPAYIRTRPMSLPVIMLALGAAIFALPLGLTAPDVTADVAIIEKVTEFAVIIALMGAGLKIDRPFGWRSWASTWRSLLIAMPLTILATMILGATLGGLAAVSALLLGSVIAPTDPVLASDVQVGEPTTVENHPHDPEDAGRAPEPETPHENEDDVRFALTSEGGLNDALAFPFVYAAIRVAEHGWDPSGWLGAWLAWDLVGRILIGLAVGWLVGRLLGIVSFRPPGPFDALATVPQGYVAVAATLLAYGATEIVSGYGFLAVFVAAVVLRSSERGHEFHAELHNFAEEIESLLSVGLLLLLGGAVVSGALDALTWRGALVALIGVFVIRPASGYVSLFRSEIRARERMAIAFFGIRGFGSIYYLSYGLQEATFPGADELWAIVSLTLVVSIVVHGIAAAPVMNVLDQDRERAAA